MLPKGCALTETTHPLAHLWPSLCSICVCQHKSAQDGVWFEIEGAGAFTKLRSQWKWKVKHLNPVCPSYLFLGIDLITGGFKNVEVERNKGHCLEVVTFPQEVSSSSSPIPSNSYFVGVVKLHVPIGAINALTACVFCPLAAGLSLITWPLKEENTELLHHEFCNESCAGRWVVCQAGGWFNSHCSVKDLKGCSVAVAAVQY